MKATFDTHSDNKSTVKNDWITAKLSDVCTLNPPRPRLTRANDSPTTFIPMAAVDDHEGVIAKPEMRPYCEISKGYTYLEEGDVLFAKITPCMQNGKHAIARNLLGGVGFASTEFHVIRPGQNITAEWVHYFVRQPSILAAAARQLTGTVGQQRIPVDFLSSLQIPLPPLDEQKKLVSHLSSKLTDVSHALAAVDAQLEAAQALPSSYLRAVFESSEIKTWPKTRLGNILHRRNEVIHPRDKPYGPAVFVGLEHIESGTGIRNGSLSIEMSQLSGRKPRFYKGDIIYGYLRPYLNKVWIAEFNGLCSVDQYVFRVDLLKADVNYITWFMRSPLFLRRAPIDITPGQLPRIRSDEVASVEIELPPLAKQQALVRYISSKIVLVEMVKKGLKEQHETINKLPAIILNHAFKGEL